MSWNSRSSLLTIVLQAEVVASGSVFMMTGVNCFCLSWLAMTLPEALMILLALLGVLFLIKACKLPIWDKPDWMCFTCTSTQFSNLPTFSAHILLFTSRSDSWRASNSKEFLKLKSV